MTGMDIGQIKIKVLSEKLGLALSKILLIKIPRILVFGILFFFYFFSSHLSFINTGEGRKGMPIKFAEPAFLPSSKDRMSFLEAQEYCHEQGARLPYIEHEDKYDDMIKLLRERQKEEGRENYVDRVWLENLYDQVGFFFDM